MANRNTNLFDEEQPKLVHFEKDESHYEYCRMQMHDIEHVHRRTFIANMIICILVCALSVFKIYVGGFGILSMPFADLDGPEAILTGGIFQILFSMIIMIIGYLAWANFHSLNIILEMWYVIVTLIGIFKLDYISALVGIIGAVFYFFSFREMQHEQALSEMEGYPDFTEKFDISKSDIVLQTLLAHQGERRTKSTLFTTDYSLRRMKKKKQDSFGAEPEEKDAGAALAEELQKHLKDAKAHQQEKAKAAEPVQLEKETASEPVQPEKEKAETSAEKEQASSLEQARAEAAAILAEAQEKARAILEEAESEKAEQKPANKPAEHKKKKNGKRN